MLGGNHGCASPWPLTGNRQNSAIVSAPAPRLGIGLALRWRRAARGEEELTEPGRFSMREPYGERMVIIHPLDRQGNTVAASAHKVVREGRRQVRPHENAPVPTRAIPAFARVQRTLMLFAYQRCDPRVGGDETIGRWVRASEYLASSHRCFFPPSGCPSRAPTGRIPALQLENSAGGHLHPLMSSLSFVRLGKIPDPDAPHRSGRPIQGGQRAGAPPGLERHPEKNSSEKGRTEWRLRVHNPARLERTRRRLRRRPPRRRAAGASLSVGRPCHPPRTGR
jgi:hypothetical protein